MALMRNLVFLLSWIGALSLLSTAEAAEGCQASVAVGPNIPAEIGRSTKEFDLAKSKPALGTVDVVKSGEFNVLQYTAKPIQAVTTETILCATAGQPGSAVEITVKPIPAAGSETLYGDVAKSLVLLFALAVMLESGLAGLFRWRPFVELLNPRAVRPLVSFALALAFVHSFDLDIVTALVNAGRSGALAPFPISPSGQLLTALVLAGGSAGVNAMLVALGLRQVGTPESAQPKPPKNRAWIAVRAQRRQGTTGDIDVFIGAMAKLTDGKQEPPYAGTIKGKSANGFWAYFTRDRGKYPGYGGYEVPLDQEIWVVLKSWSAGEQLLETTWGPHKPAAGAIIDLDLEI